MSHPCKDKLNEVAALLQRARRVLLITGAGISADSGLPTYRGIGGLYNQQQTEDGYTIEKCLSGTMFKMKPEITWKYMIQLGLTIVQHRPNDAHHIIAQWEKQFAAQGGKVVVVMQNIDGYHRAANSKNVYEFHGSLEIIYCTSCTWSEEFQMDTTLLKQFETLQESLPPRCPKCNALIRPRVVLSEENLPLRKIEKFQSEFNKGIGFDLVFSIGTSALFLYIFGPFLTAASQGISTVEINPAKSELSKVAQIYLPMQADEALTEIEKLRKILPL